MSGRLQSLFLLGLALLKTLLLRLGVQSGGVRRFKEVYGVEGILNTTPFEHSVLRRASACTACGRCDADQGVRIARSRVGYRGMMAFALSGSRSLTDSRASAQLISELDLSEFAAAEQLCPRAVPLVDLARLVRGHAARLESDLGLGGSGDHLTS